MALNGLKTLYSNLNDLDLEQEQYQIIEDNKEELVIAQTEVLSEGKDKYGQKRSDDYRPMTIEEKAKSGIVGLGRVIDRVTFYMRGNLYASLFAKVSKRTFSIESPLDTYTKMLNRIGNENYGLDPQRIFMFKQTITIPKLKEVFFRKTGLNM